MAELTPALISYLRAKSGDNCSPYVVDDPLLQTYYDAAEGSLYCTIVSILEDRRAAVKIGAAKLTDFGVAVDTAEKDNIVEMLEYYQARCGEGGAVLQVGVLNLGIDARTADLTDPNASWLWGDAP